MEKLDRSKKCSIYGAQDLGLRGSRPQGTLDPLVMLATKRSAGVTPEVNPRECVNTHASAKHK